MAQSIIAARGVSKRYILGGPSRGTNSLREAIGGAVRAPFRRWSSRSTENPLAFWALNEVSFDVFPSEVLGIIGRNGAGKSTLLKVLSRITEPTAGRIELNGRIASLLEVGTGFHPELTGRENVYLNGTILGMRKREVDRKFDEIVAFAEVERFIDTPVKRYSSGMYVRLAFAVAAHLEPEILIVDEVLAVGDANFQQKCLGKMSDVAHEGRTVLFVSHNMAAVRGLCSRALLLDQGRVAIDGTTDRVIGAYLAGASALGTGASTWSYRHRGDRVAIESVDLFVDAAPTTTVQSGDQVTFRIHYRTLQPEVVGEELSLSIMLFSEGHKLVNLWTNVHGGRGLPLSAQGVFDCVIPRWPFRTGMFRADVYSHIGVDAQDFIEECISFNSHDGDFYDSGVITNPDQGIVFLDHRWTHAHQ